MKLKQPEGNPLFNHYLNTLDNSSRKTLGSLILDYFIAQDTLNPSDDEANAYADQNKTRLYNHWQKWSKSEWGQEYKDHTIDDAHQVLFKNKKKEYLGSAITEKGILALIAFAEPSEAVARLQRYMKDHYTRRHQIEAMLMSIANSDHPAVIQLILSLARRYRTRSVKEKAIELVDSIAARNGWSHDELADRTIPTAGLEANGEQILSYGSRTLTIKLDEKLKLIIENEAGKTLKSLPAPRQDDDAEQVSASKKELSAAKKELKQVLDLQSKRLYDAMCSGREWPFSEWREFLLEHPIMQRLLQRIVWRVTSSEQTITMRPTAELEFIDLEDEEHLFSDTDKIKVAHAIDLTADERIQWQQHIKDDAITPLFDQFSLPKHSLTEKDLNGNSLSYHKGWLTDAFTLRGILTKRGYQRGEAEDGGIFTHYFKEFRDQKLKAIIEFSGNALPEENCTAVLFNIAFVRETRKGWFTESDYRRINDIAPSLLHEIQLDYEAVAAKATFDPDWESKTPW